MRLVNVWVDGYFTPVDAYELNGVWQLSAPLLGEHRIDASATHECLAVVAGMLRMTLRKYGVITHKSPFASETLDSRQGPR